MNTRNTLCLLGALLLFLMATTLDSCYLLKQGYYLAADHLSAESIDKLMAHSTDSSLVSFLTLAQRIKRFAVDSLGLADDHNYTTYVQTDRPYMVDVVSAARADSFEQHTWCYPIVGCVPYQGYYDTTDAANMAAKLRAKGLDVYRWHAGAFSSLGILRDPLYSFMRRSTTFALASLIIHEQTHATLYLKGQAQFNEELATFVGTQGALAFLAATLGDTSSAYRTAQARLRDKHRFRTQIGTLYRRLDSLYRGDAPTVTKLQRKHALITDHQSHFAAQYDTIYETEHYRGFGTAEVNNAYLCVHATYNEDLALYTQLFAQCDSDLQRTISVLLGAKEAAEDPKQYLREQLRP